MEISPNPIEVGNRIRTIRTNQGYSMDEFANKIDERAKSGTVSNWETGKNLPNNARLKRIAEIGETSINYLLTGEENVIPHIKENTTKDEKWNLVNYIGEITHSLKEQTEALEKTINVSNEQLSKIKLDIQKLEDLSWNFEISSTPEKN